MKASFRGILFLVLAVAVSFSGCTAPAPAQEPAGPGTENPALPAETAAMKAVAGEIVLSIDEGLADMKAGLRNTAETLSVSGLSGATAEQAMSANLLRHPWTLSSFAISRDGIVLAAVPGNYAGHVGADLRGQSIVRDANAKQAPAVSAVFPMVEGYTAISQSSPVFSPSGEYLGYTDLTYKPQVFLARQIGEVAVPPAYDVWVVQADGTQIYDVNDEEVGKNIVTDPLYADPALHAVLTRIAAEQNGTGTYSFYDRDWNRTITKTAVWETAGIDGAAWRVVVTKEAGTDGIGSAATATVVTTADPAGLTTEARYANLTQFVTKAATYAREHGKEAALQEFNNVNGSFIDGDLYVFAYEMNGTVLALPYQRGLLGTDRTGVADTNGVLFIDRLKEIAAEGGGSVSYTYANPKDTYREQFKIAYVLPVDATWFVGSGIYLPEIPAGFNTTERDALVLRVKEAQQYAQARDRATAVAAFNDPNGTFADGSRYIFAYAADGTTLALPFQPEVIGTNRRNFTDTWGVKITAWEIATAERGGGFVYVDYPNPETGRVGLKLCYVAPVDATWLVGSGIYTDRT